MTGLRSQRSMKRGRSGVLQAATEKLPALDNRFHGSYQVDSGSCFQNVALRPCAESLLQHISKRFLGHEDYFGFRG